MARLRPILLVHGAWHGAWCWATLQAELDRRGLPSYAVDLPGHGLSTLPLGDLHGDAGHVASVLAGFDDEVVLVGHSYGGAVVTHAAGSAQAVADRVSHLVYLTAFALDDGESVWTFARSRPRAARRPRRGRARWRRRHLPSRSRQGAGGALRDVSDRLPSMPPSPGSAPSRSHRSNNRSRVRRGRRSARRT